MIKEDYRFDTMAAFQRDWLFTWTFTISIWFGLPTYYNWGHLKLEDYFSWPALIFPGFMFILFLITWFWSRGISYEVSSTKLVIRWGKYILRSVKLSDVQGIIGKYPIRLKITDQRDFIFDDIGIFSSYRKLRSLLQELGITKIKTKVSKSGIIRRLLMVLSFLVIAYFAFSVIIMWYLVGLYIPYLCFRDDPIDWVMFLHAIPAVVLFFASIAALIFGHKQRIRMSFITLGLVLGISVLCFFIETTNNLFQAFYPANATGDINSTTRIGGRHHYWNWWWWHDNVVDYSYLFPNVTYKYGCIDKTGRIVAEPQFDKVYGFSESMARIELDDKYGYIDKNGAIRVKPNLDNARNFH